MEKKDKEEIPARNEDIEFLRDENRRLKDMLGRSQQKRPRRQANAGQGIRGMQGMQGFGVSVDIPQGYSKNRK